MSGIRPLSRMKSELLKKNMQLYSLLLPVFILIFIFHYIPIYGIIIAFQNYVPGASFLGPGVEWVGFRWFIRFIQSEYFVRLIRNTVVLSIMGLVFGFAMPILFALLLDQLQHTPNFRKFTQTASYLPHFISTVIIAGMVINFVDSNGLITTFLTYFGLPRQAYLMNKGAFPIIYTVTNIWKGFGFGSILYVSTITSIDPGQYESAKIDGANRWQQCWYITIPGIQRIIAINLIMAVGGILGADSGFILLLYNPAIYETADVIGTYTYRVGLVGGEFSYTAAVGLFMSLIGFILTYTANKVSNKLTDFGLW
jgi:putative aldouronate transport system permease protein